MAMVLKTIVAATSPWVRIPRPPLRPRKTGPDLGLYLLISRRRLVANRSQMQPTATICRWSRDIRGMDLEAFPQVNLRKTEGSRRKRDPCMVDRSGGQCFIDPPVSGLLAAVDALRVHPQQHLHPVTCAFSGRCFKAAPLRGAAGASRCRALRWGARPARARHLTGKQPLINHIHPERAGVARCPCSLPHDRSAARRWPLRRRRCSAVAVQERDDG